MCRLRFLVQNVLHENDKKLIMFDVWLQCISVNEKYDDDGDLLQRTVVLQRKKMVQLSRSENSCLSYLKSKGLPSEKNMPDYNLSPLKPHFYTEKLGFTGIYQISFFYSKHTLWVLVYMRSLF